MLARTTGTKERSQQTGNCQRNQTKANANAENESENGKWKRKKRSFCAFAFRFLFLSFFIFYVQIEKETKKWYNFMRISPLDESRRRWPRSVLRMLKDPRRGREVEFVRNECARSWLVGNALRCAATPCWLKLQVPREFGSLALR